MAYTGKRNQFDLVYQVDGSKLRVGIPPQVTTEQLAVLSGATLPAFDLLVVKPSGTSKLGTVTEGFWAASGITEPYGGTGQSSYAAGDILYASGPNVLAKRAVGLNTAFLRLSAGLPVWTTGVAVSDGGTGRGFYSQGDLLFADGTQSLTVLPSGSEGQVLQVAAGVLAWATPASTPLPTVLLVTTPAVTIADTDRYVMVSGQGLVTVSLTAGPLVGEEHFIKDRQGIAASSGITVDGNGNLIDGVATASLVNNYESLGVVWDGAQWSII
jgi:hypothetical protein